MTSGRGSASHSDLNRLRSFRQGNGRRGKVHCSREVDDLYREFRLDEKWDSPHNSRLLNRMPGAFRSPRNGPDDPGATYYQVFTGEGAVFENPTGLTRDEIRNGRGLENTLLVVEAADA